MPIEDLLDAGAFTARFEKLDRVFCNVGRHWLELLYRPPSRLVLLDQRYEKSPRPMTIKMSQLCLVSPNASDDNVIERLPKPLHASVRTDGVDGEDRARVAAAREEAAASALRARTSRAISRQVSNSV